jgi:hypothetical protein
MTTSTPSMVWVKLYTSLLDDSRFARLTDAQYARYFQLIMLAGKLDAGGSLCEHGRELSEEEIAWKLRLTAATLAADLDALSTAGLICKNGHGWYIQEFEEQQGPTQAERRADWLQRQHKHRLKSVTPSSRVTSEPVTGDCSFVTPLESESESESESDKESESVCLKSSRRAATDDGRISLTKPEIIRLIGIPGKHQKQILADGEITDRDLVAELARNYARKGQDKGQVKQPGSITALNLLRHEYPEDAWYDPAAWLKYLPEGLTAKLGVAISQDEELEGEKVIEVATRIFQKDETVTPIVVGWWQQACEQLQQQMPKTAYDTWLAGTAPVHYEPGLIGLLRLAAANAYTRDWLAQRMTSTTERILTGIAAQAIKIEFVVQEAQ